jgi:hypothetical protein
MANEPNGGSTRGGSAQDFDRLFGGANPNPKRQDCPPSEVLQSLARKERPIGDPAYQHLAKCSPCYRDFRRFQTATARGYRRPRYYALAAVFAIAVMGVSLYLLPTRREIGPTTQARPTPPPQVPQTPSPLPAPVVVAARADLRRLAPTRGVSQGSRGGPVQLPKALVSLTVLLPVGSEPGHYALQLVRSDGQPVASTTADAAILNFVTTLKVELDLRQVDPASYDLEVRRDGEQWNSYPVTIK